MFGMKLYPRKFWMIKLWVLYKILIHRTILNHHNFILAGVHLRSTSPKASEAAARMIQPRFLRSTTTAEQSHRAFRHGLPFPTRGKG